MGRIKTKMVKRVVKKLMGEQVAKFKPDFEKNKKLIIDFVDVPSKKLRNVMAGYITRLVKKQK